MPVESSSGGARSRKKSAPLSVDPQEMYETHSCRCPYVKGVWSADFGRKILYTLFGILIAYGIVLAGTMIRNNLQRYHFIGQADRPERTITLEGEGRVTAAPDVAVVTMGVIVKGDTVAEAQKKSTDTMNALIDKLKALGVDPSDIQTTNYNIYPKIRYTQADGEIPDGYEVNQNVTIKIRDLNKAGSVVALAGEVGANTVQGMEFRIDDPEVYREQAREEALAKIAEKADRLGQALGVRLIRIISYNEYEPGSGDMPLYAERAYGGGMASVSTGSNDVVLHVSVTYDMQ